MPFMRQFSPQEERQLRAARAKGIRIGTRWRRKTKVWARKHPKTSRTLAFLGGAHLGAVPGGILYRTGRHLKGKAGKILRIGGALAALGGQGYGGYKAYKWMKRKTL